MGAGVSGTFAVAENAIGEGNAAQAAPGGAQSAAEREAVVEGALVEASVAPGVAPWVGARVGIGGNNEAGLAYAGRSLRLDGRHAFEWGKIALSFGAGASAILSRPDERAQDAEGPPQGGIIGAEVGSTTGFGLDVPILIGWRSDASLVQAWAGARAGFESLTGSLSMDIDNPDPTLARLRYDFDAVRFWGGALVGLSVGVRPLSVALELDAAFFDVSGDSELADGDLGARGLSLRPSAALIAHF